MVRYCNPKWHKLEKFQIYCSNELLASLTGSGVDYCRWFEENIYALKFNEKKESGHLVWPDQRVFFYKRTAANFTHKMLYPLLVYRARRIFNLSLMLVKAGISVPRPEAIIKSFSQGSVCFLSEALRETKALNTHIKRLNRPGQINLIFKRLAHAIAHLHRSGYFHGDMNWKNILLGAGSEQKFYFIDLDTAGRLSSTNDTRYARDIARFNIDIIEKTSDLGHCSVFLHSYSYASGTPIKTLINHMKPYHIKIAAKHRSKYGSNIPDLSVS